MADPKKHNPDWVDIGPLKEKIKQSGLSYNQISQYTGINDRNVRNMMSVAKYITIKNATKMCRELGIDPVDVGI